MEKTTKPTKRRIKNPETFREKARKAQNEKDQRIKNSNHIIKKSLRVLFNPIVKLVSTLYRIKALKPLFWIIKIIGLIIYPRYVRNSFKELKDVTWPSFKESMRLTYAVVIFAIIFGVAVALVDYGFGKIFKIILLK